MQTLAFFMSVFQFEWGHSKMAAEEKLALPNPNFFAAVKYHVVGGSLQDQVWLWSKILSPENTLFSIIFDKIRPYFCEWTGWLKFLDELSTFFVCC